MFIVFHELPLTVMFIVILSMSVLACWLLIGLVRFAVPRLGFQPDEPLPIRDSIINASGALFALMVAFSAAGIWNDAVAARNAVQREADAMESTMVLSAALPDAARSRLHDLLRSYLQDVIAADWPAMAKSLPPSDPAFDQSEKHLLGAIEFVSRQSTTAADSSAYAPLLGQLLQVRHARLARLTSSQAGITWAQWIAMWLISTVTLLAVVICNSHSFRMQIVAAHLYVLVVSAAYFVILAHDRPFVGSVSVKPAALQALVKS